MADKIRVESDGLSAALEAQLSKYNDELNDKLTTCVEESINQLVKLTKATAPKGHRNGQYKKNISADKRELKRAKRGAHGGFHGRVTSATWYVKAPDYRLTHLLVHGHATKDGGRTRANPFLQNAVDKVIPEYERRVQEAIENDK
jgi:hypothetical protein